MTGTVKWFNAEKGYGYVHAEGNGIDYFLHFSEITGRGFKALDAGDVVEFQPQQTPKGMRATRVRKVASSTQAADSPYRDTEDAGALARLVLSPLSPTGTDR